jgi:hypothetical protein
MIIKSEWFMNLLSKINKFRVDGFAFWPFIILRPGLLEQTEKTIINHERIHLAQQKECFILGFYLIYAGNYIYNLIKYRKSAVAYYYLMFEAEAYAKQGNLDYLNWRKDFAWRHY